MDTGALEDRLRDIAEEVRPRELAVEFGPVFTKDRASVNEDVVMHAASTMKLAVLLALVQADDAGTLALDSNLPVVNRFQSVVDGSDYALDPADDGETDLYLHVGESMHVRELARRMICSSSNLATNVLMERLTPARVQAAAEFAGASDTRILRGVQDLKAFDAGLVNVTTAHDLALLLEALVFDAANDSAGIDAWPLELLRHQEFDEMIPAGLPPGTVVLHKTGEITRIHHDAAIVVLPWQDWFITECPCVLVVMTRGFDDPKESAAVGARIARTIYDFVAPEPAAAAHAGGG
jgi:beta-lactamase class A